LLSRKGETNNILDQALLQKSLNWSQANLHYRGQCHQPMAKSLIHSKVVGVGLMKYVKRNCKEIHSSVNRFDAIINKETVVLNQWWTKLSTLVLCMAFQL
jgi:hypothetical protein